MKKGKKRWTKQRKRAAKAGVARRPKLLDYSEDLAAATLRQRRFKAFNALDPRRLFPMMDTKEYKEHREHAREVFSRSRNHAFADEGHDFGLSLREAIDELLASGNYTAGDDLSILHDLYPGVSLTHLVRIYAEAVQADIDKQRRFLERFVSHPEDFTEARYTPKPKPERLCPVKRTCRWRPDSSDWKGIGVGDWVIYKPVPSRDGPFVIGRAENYSGNLAVYIGDGEFELLGKEVNSADVKKIRPDVIEVIRKLFQEG